MNTSTFFTYDALIAYAQADRKIVKEGMLDPLAEEGLKVWDYVKDIKLGDSFLNGISQALQQARYGIVFVSPNLIGEKWSEEMYRNLLNLDSPDRKVVLPVWYGYNFAEIAQDHPFLLDRKPAIVEQGWDLVHQQLVKALLNRSPTPRIIKRQAKLSLPDHNRNIHIQQEANEIKQNFINGDVDTLNM